MKFIHISEWAFYERLTTSLAFRGLAKRLGAEIQCIDIEDFGGRRIERDETASIVTFHAAHSKIYSFPVSEMRTYWPNAKIVALGSDSIPYLHGYTHQDARYGVWKDYEYNSPEEVDLHLDTLSEVIRAYSSRGVKTDQWLWTASESYMDYVSAFARPHISPSSQKDIDAISLIDVKTEYRRNMRDYLVGKGLKVAIGTGEQNLDRIWNWYRRSWVVIGTTSGGWTPQRTMKGFRDWLAPVLGTVLIYDDHEDAVENYPWDTPFYEYGDFEQIATFIKALKGDPWMYSRIVNSQLEWAKENTLENQFEKLFKKHGIC